MLHATPYSANRFPLLCGEAPALFDQVNRALLVAIVFAHEGEVLQQRHIIRDERGFRLEPLHPLGPDLLGAPVLPLLLIEHAPAAVEVADFAKERRIATGRVEGEPVPRVRPRLVTGIVSHHRDQLVPGEAQVRTWHVGQDDGAFRERFRGRLDRRAVAPVGEQFEKLAGEIEETTIVGLKERCGPFKMTPREGLGLIRLSRRGGEADEQLARRNRRQLFPPLGRIEKGERFLATAFRGFELSAAEVVEGEGEERVGEWQVGFVIDPLAIDRLDAFRETSEQKIVIRSPPFRMQEDGLYERGEPRRGRGRGIRFDLFPPREGFLVGGPLPGTGRLRRAGRVAQGFKFLPPRLVEAPATRSLEEFVEQRFRCGIIAEGAFCAD